MMRVRAVDVPDDGARTETAGLALNASKGLPVVDDQVVTRVFTERHRQGEASPPKRQHDCKLSSVAYVLRVIHAHSLPVVSAGPWPELTTRASPTMWLRRSSSVGRARLL